MDILLGVGTLVLVLVIMTLFLKYAPYGKQGLQALSGAACATFLPQAFLSYAIGGVFDIKFLQDIGDLAGSLSGIAVGILTCLNLGVAPVFAVILGLVIPVTGMTPLSSMVLTSLLGLTGVPMAIGALTCTGSSFVNLILFRKLNIGGPSKAFAVCIEPLTQIDLIAQYPVQLYGTNALIGVVNACIVTFSGLVIGVKGMATPIAGAIVLFGFNNAVTSIVTIATVIIVSIVLAYIIGTLINKFNLMNINFKMPSKKNHIKESV
ncbi:TPA: PTS sugar transporter subunit IIC [Staphylococcus aureus]|nr:PTS sugar transporter subunit IIC [Staphylococcus aureus]